jgi:hypothetical protein
MGTASPLSPAARPFKGAIVPAMWSLSAIWRTISAVVARAVSRARESREPVTRVRDGWSDFIKEAWWGKRTRARML